MNNITTRRRFLAGTGMAAALATLPALTAHAQAGKPKLRFSAVFSEQDIRAEMMKKFAEGIGNDFTFEGYYGGNLFKQGTELVAIQRGNLEMGNIAPQDISKQIPAWSILTATQLPVRERYLRAAAIDQIVPRHVARGGQECGLFGGWRSGFVRPERPRFSGPHFTSTLLIVWMPCSFAGKDECGQFEPMRQSPIAGAAQPNRPGTP